MVVRALRKCAGAGAEGLSGESGSVWLGIALSSSIARRFQRGCGIILAMRCFHSSLAISCSRISRAVP